MLPLGPQDKPVGPAIYLALWIGAVIMLAIGVFVLYEVLSDVDEKVRAGAESNCGTETSLRGSGGTSFHQE